MSKARTGPIGLHYVRIGFNSTRRYGDLVSSNLFDDDDGSFFVSVNDEEQHGRGPAFADVPAG